MKTDTDNMKQLTTSIQSLLILCDLYQKSYVQERMNNVQRAISAISRRENALFVLSSSFGPHY